MAKKEKLTERLQTPCTPTFYKMLKKAAQAKYMTSSEFIRQAVLEKIQRG